MPELTYETQPEGWLDPTGPSSAFIQVVGLGASAGGIEALSEFFKAMSPTSGCAFVVVIHLDPERESEMARVLSTSTVMSVVQIKDGMTIEENHIYVIAPATDVKVSNGKLLVSAPIEPRGQRHPVDVLFRSLARDQQQRAIAIVLSGTGTNGTDGLKDIRAAGGMTIVQTPSTAQFDGMPRSAIAAGMADHIHAPTDMPNVVLAFAQHGYVSSPALAEASSPEGRVTLEQILELLRMRGGHDFRSYKHSTLGRRIHRRLGLRNIDSLDKYIAVLRADPAELATLAGDLLISVTGFFRDPDAWKALADLVIAPIIAERESGAAIRVWVAACSTGEEAYSIAILITEMADAAGKHFALKVFATDLQESNLKAAREGIYPTAALADFSAMRLRRFFEPLDGAWQVSKILRDMVVFAPQNLLQDAPFSRIDLVSCRNFLIYLEPEAQQRIIALSHFALSEGGHLFLGSAETVGRYDDLFRTLSKKWRIYSRQGPTRHDLISIPRQVSHAEPADATNFPLQFPDAGAPMAEFAKRILLEQFAPASVLIDRKDRVLYFHGPTSEYLEHPAGEPTRDLLAMAREGLAVKLRSAVREATRTNTSVTVTARIRHGGNSQPVLITVTPLRPTAQANGFLLVSFARAVKSLELARTVVRGGGEDYAVSEQLLQDELKTIRAELLTTVEHLETSNEELKASNEEAVSINEELQSTNEELETSKEELQSFNEELNTVNSQLQHKIAELENVTNDLKNLLVGSETATLFLDDNYCVKWFSPAIREHFHLVSTDVGRPIAHFASKFSDPNLLRDAEAVLDKLIPIDAEVRSDLGRWYVRRMLPYRTQDNRIAGVVITFLDITVRKQEEVALRLNEARLQELIEALPGAVYTTDIAGRVTSFNPAIAKLWGRSPEPGEFDPVALYWPDGTPVPKDKSPWATAVNEKHGVREVEVAIAGPNGSRIPILVSTALLRDATGEIRGAVNMLVDITESRRADAIERRLASIVEYSDDAIISKDLDGKIASWNHGAERLLGYTAAEAVGKSILLLIPPDRHDEETAIMMRLRQGDHIENFETERLAKNGTSLWVSLTVSPLRNIQGEVIGASKILRSLTERRLADEHTKILINELNHRVKNTLAVVQAIASQTFGHGATLEKARKDFSGRVMNLSSAHDILTRENWAGADLIDVVTDSVRPLSGGQNRFLINGPHVRLGTNAALAFAMALHELGTNAAKYGALSTDKGNVDISWLLDDVGSEKQLQLTWKETGGPTVSPRTRRGFGSRLIEDVLSNELDGKVVTTFEPGGVVCIIATALNSEEILQKH